MAHNTHLLEGIQPTPTNIPVLEPHLHLTRTKPGNLSRKSLSMCGIGVWLLGKLAHQEPRLLMGKPEQD